MGKEKFVKRFANQNTDLERLYRSIFTYLKSNGFKIIAANPTAMWFKFKLEGSMGYANAYLRIQGQPNSFMIWGQYELETRGRAALLPVVGLIGAAASKHGAKESIELLISRLPEIVNSVSQVGPTTRPVARPVIQRPLGTRPPAYRPVYQPQYSYQPAYAQRYPYQYRPYSTPGGTTVIREKIIEKPVVIEKEKKIFLMPNIPDTCPSCGGPINEENVKGASAKCSYCGSSIELEMHEVGTKS